MFFGLRMVSNEKRHSKEKTLACTKILSSILASLTFNMSPQIKLLHVLAISRGYISFEEAN